jgi:hypothetical protein
MKTKLLFTVLCFAFYSHCFSQLEASGYLSNLEEPSGMINQGNILYVQGPKNLYQVHTALTSPAAATIYTAAANFYMTNLAISGNVIYISEENYDEVADEFLGSRIIALDLNNLAAPVNVVYTSTQYVSSLAIKDAIIYFSSETDPDEDDNFTVQIHKIDSTLPNPTATVLVSNLSENEEANDMAFYNNNLLISVGGVGKVFGFDASDEVIVASEYINNLNFNKGLFVIGNSLFLAEANLIGTKQLDIPASLTPVAKNTLYQDIYNGVPFNANFRDVVLIGNTLYMTLANQGRVVAVQDESFLSANEFDADLNTISIYNTTTEIVVSGLESNQTAALYNLSGQLLVTKNLSFNDNSMDVSSYPKGLYFLKLENQKVFKLIK